MSPINSYQRHQLSKAKSLPVNEMESILSLLSFPAAAKDEVTACESDGKHCRPIRIIQDSSCLGLNYWQCITRRKKLSTSFVFANFIDNSFLHKHGHGAIGECCQSCGHSCIDKRTAPAQRKEGVGYY